MKICKNSTRTINVQIKSKETGEKTQVGLFKQSEKTHSLQTKGYQEPSSILLGTISEIFFWFSLGTYSQDLMITRTDPPILEMTFSVP